MNIIFANTTVEFRYDITNPWRQISSLDQLGVVVSSNIKNTPSQRLSVTGTLPSYGSTGVISASVSFGASPLIYTVSLVLDYWPTGTTQYQVLHSQRVKVVTPYNTTDNMIERSLDL